ncbi:MAG: hypothetical protein J3Q66DRAFT_291040, partial [Benniella sp.]
FPLLPAYGLSIHHAQGLTLRKAVVQLAGSFCRGQAYVALSRVRSWNDLFIVVDINIQEIQ